MIGLPNVTGKSERGPLVTVFFILDISGRYNPTLFGHHDYGMDAGQVLATRRARRISVKSLRAAHKEFGVVGAI